MMEYKSLNRQFWGRHIWARGYFDASSGNVTDDVIAKYIEEQGKEHQTITSKLMMTIFSRLTADNQATGFSR